MDNLYSNRIGQMRSLMRSRGWDAVIVTGSDPHSSEYPALRWKQVEWLTGFTGEAGDVVITADHAGLWTDTRYFIQADRQLAGTGALLHKTRVPDQVLIPEWLAARFPQKDCLVIAVDGLCQQVSAIDDLRRALEDAGRKPDTDDDYSYRIVDVPDMLDLLWEDRPQIPVTPVMELSEDVAGESRTQRIEWLRESIASTLCDGTLITSLDEIAWLLNVRGSDIEYNPMVISYLLVTEDRVRWFVRKDSSDDDPYTRATFASVMRDGVEVLPYDEIQLALAQCIRDQSVNRLAVDPGTLNWSLWNLMEDSGRLVPETSPVQLRKAIKNAAEIRGMKAMHIRDGVAMEKFLYWLETETAAGCEIDEWSAAVKLGEYRAEIPEYMGDSFETISAYGPGGALPHYITPRNDAPAIRARGLFLCDSGGQYSCGTTDITRTVPMGPCTYLEMEDYTLVLKGHIGLARAIFPKGTAGCQLDALARGPMWQSMRSFGHGTGHGVGFWLGVHEGPQDIRQNFNRQSLLPGMITSVEPGIYREGMHGVRHENLVLCVEAGSNEFGDWLRFEPLTLCHFDTGILVRDLLSADEIDWLNRYNAHVYETLSPLLPTEVALWLKDKTAPV